MRERALVIMKGSDHDHSDDNTDDMLMMLMMKLMTILSRLVMWL